MIDYLVSVATLAVIFAVVALALNVRWGWAGEFDFFVYGLVALGAYVYAVFTLPPAPSSDTGFTYVLGLNAPFVVGILGAMAVTGLVSFVVGVIALRNLRQVFFGITTFSAVLIMSAVISQEAGLFNGYSGVFGVPQPFNDFLKLPDQQYAFFYLGLSIVSLVVVYLILERIFWSPYGLVLRAIREDEIAAAAFGKSSFSMRLKAYVLGGVISGFAGALLIGYLTAWNTDAWTPAETILIFGCLIIGGQGNSRGAILGSFIVFGAILEGTRFLPPIPGHPDAIAAIRVIAIAAVMLVFMRWRPRGILPEPHLRDGESSPKGGGLKALVVRAARSRP